MILPTITHTMSSFPNIAVTTGPRPPPLCPSCLLPLYNFQLPFEARTPLESIMRNQGALEGEKEENKRMKRKLYKSLGQEISDDEDEMMDGSHPSSSNCKGKDVRIEEVDSGGLGKSVSSGKSPQKPQDYTHQPFSCGSSKGLEITCAACNTSFPLASLHNTPETAVDFLIATVDAFLVSSTVELKRLVEILDEMGMEENTALLKAMSLVERFDWESGRGVGESDGDRVLISGGEDVEEELVSIWEDDDDDAEEEADEDDEAFVDDREGEDEDMC